MRFNLFMENKINELKNSKWSDRYFCRLAMLDHIRECLEKDNFLKATDAPKDSDGYKHLEKELMDLKIILDLYFNDYDNLHETRINKFINNLDNNSRKV